MCAGCLGQPTQRAPGSFVVALLAPHLNDDLGAMRSGEAVLAQRGQSKFTDQRWQFLKMQRRRAYLRLKMMCSEVLVTAKSGHRCCRPNDWTVSGYTAPITPRAIPHLGKSMGQQLQEFFAHHSINHDGDEEGLNEKNSFCITCHGIDAVLRTA